MKTSLLLSIFFTAGFMSLAASAQTQTPDLAHLYPGYDPTVFKDTADIKKIFSEMPTDFKAEKSQCFQRAEIWTYDLFRNRQINAMKVFVFYTHSFRDYKEQQNQDFNWWFHVAPYVLYQTAKGEIKEAVLDPTFADAPMNMKSWAKMFVTSGKPCKEFVRYSDFANEVEDETNQMGDEHCYLVRVPATDYDPNAVADRDSGKVTDYEFNLGDVAYAAENAPNKGIRKEIYKRLGL